jgi:hypothetical protein
MRGIVFWSVVLLMGSGVLRVGAIDVDPSKNTIPRSSFDTGGNRFSIFNGDPKRIQRANAVDPAAFDCALTVSPNPLPLATTKTGTPNPVLKLTFAVHNHGKKTYTLSFPNAQRWDFRIKTPAGQPIYVYSDNCDFEQKVGISMVNHDDKLTYSEIIEFSDLSAPLVPGTYTVEAVLANYPAIKATTNLVVQP